MNILCFTGTKAIIFHFPDSLINIINNAPEYTKNCDITTANKAKHSAVYMYRHCAEKQNTKLELFDDILRYIRHTDIYISYSLSLFSVARDKWMGRNGCMVNNRYTDDMLPYLCEGYEIIYIYIYMLPIKQKGDIPTAASRLQYKYPSPAPRQIEYIIQIVILYKQFQLFHRRSPHKLCHLLLSTNVTHSPVYVER